MLRYQLTSLFPSHLYCRKYTLCKDTICLLLKGELGSMNSQVSFRFNIPELECQPSVCDSDDVFVLLSPHLYEQSCMLGSCPSAWDLTSAQLMTLLNYLLKAAKTDVAVPALMLLQPTTCIGPNAGKFRDTSLSGTP